jgi:hypothetical protein
MKRSIKTILAALCVSLSLAAPALAIKESEFQKRFCAGMLQEQILKSGARLDCLSGTHAIEVEFSKKWAEAIGQALHYAAETDLKPGIILVCKKDESICLKHIFRAESTLSHWKLPITVWRCGAEMQTLDECLITNPGATP